MRAPLGEGALCNSNYLWTCRWFSFSTPAAPPGFIGVVTVLKSWQSLHRSMGLFLILSEKPPPWPFWTKLQKNKISIFPLWIDLWYVLILRFVRIWSPLYTLFVLSVIFTFVDTLHIVFNKCLCECCACFAFTKNRLNSSVISDCSCCSCLFLHCECCYIYVWIWVATGSNCWCTPESSEHFCSHGFSPTVRTSD